MKKSTYIFLLLIVSLLFASCNKDKMEVSSPDDNLHLSYNSIDGNLHYNITWGNEILVNSSLISILDDIPHTIVSVEERLSDSSWNPTYGQFSEVRDNYRELVLNLDLKGIKGKLITRVYNEGVGFRFELNDLLPKQNLLFYSEYDIVGSNEIFCPAGESEPLGPIALSDLTNSLEKMPKLTIPTVVENSNNVHLALLESDLFAVPGFNSMRLSFYKDKNVLNSYSTTSKKEGHIITPWKVILIGSNAGDLVTNNIPVNLATPCQIEDTDWIKPGKTLWDWRVHGYTAPDGFTYGINNESYYRFIDFAADKGIEYFLIDDSWYKHASAGHFELSDELDLAKVSDYAKQKGVDLILYYDRKHGEYGDEALFPYYQSIGMKGIKYGFMGGNVDFSRNAIKLSADSKMLIDFHDAPVPFTGVQRTYPNAITREYCHAQQDSRRAFTPEAFIKMALINAIQGPLDMNNGNFDITGINSGIREKSPRKKNSYFSTVTSEVARTLVIFSGLVCIPDAPDAYEAKADLFEFIQNMPVGKWDETRILHAEMGKHITTARRHSEEWFIGSVIDREGGVLDINLDFLKAGTEYEVTFYEDTKETHCATNPEAYRIRTAKAVKGELVRAEMAPGGGHCMWIRPKN